MINQNEQQMMAVDVALSFAEHIKLNKYVEFCANRRHVQILSGGDGFCETSLIKASLHVLAAEVRRLREEVAALSKTDPSHVALMDTWRKLTKDTEAENAKLRKLLGAARQWGISSRCFDASVAMTVGDIVEAMNFEAPAVKTILDPKGLMEFFVISPAAPEIEVRS